MQATHGLNKQQLSNILGKREQYKQLSQQPVDKKNVRNRKGVRAQVQGANSLTLRL